MRAEEKPMPTTDKLLEVIALQTEVAGLGLDLDLGRLLDRVVKRTLRLVDAEGAALEMVEGDEMVYRAVAGMAEGNLGLRLERSHSLSGLCVAEGRALSCEDALQDPRCDRAACERMGLRSMVVVPLRHHGVTVGVLKAMSRQAGHFVDRHLALLKLVSELVAAAMYFATRFAPGELFHKATHDGLTDLPNRSLFMDRLYACMAQAQRDGQPLAVLMLDMNGLKAINDSCGHRAGDAALLAFSRRLAGALRQSDTAARLGGDEFGVLLRPLSADGGLAVTMRRLAGQINGSVEFEGRLLPVGASIGAASFPEDGADVTRLLELADQRMYRDKRALQHASA
jgi:diguanylate cyclase (GGDEF)-like protein